MFGFVCEFIKNPRSSTGYSVKMLIDKPEAEFRILDVSENVFDMQFDQQYKFPLIGEYCFDIICDKNGVVTDLYSAYKGHCNAVYSFGSPKTVASVLKIGEGYIEFTDLAEQFAEGRLVYYDDYKKLNAKEIQKGTRISLSKDLTVYCLDWTRNETTFSRIDIDFLKRILGDNVYWMTIFNLKSNNEEFDCITVTRNYKKDENSFLGDLAKLHLTREQLTKPQTQ
jgi:hypothetical protein